MNETIHLPVKGILNKLLSFLLKYNQNKISQIIITIIKGGRLIRKTAYVCLGAKSLSTFVGK